MSKEFDNDLYTEDEVFEEVEVKMDSINFGDFEIGDDDDDKPKKPKKAGSTPSFDNKEIIMEDDELSSSEKIKLLGDEVISCMVNNTGDLRNHVMGKLFSSVDPKLFRDECYIIYKVLFKFRDKYRLFSIDDEFLEMYLYRNRDLIESSKKYIDVFAYGDVDGQEDLAYISGVVKYFNRLKGMPEVSIEEFEKVFEEYKIEFKSIEFEKIYAKANLILRDGISEGRKKLIGCDASTNYVRKKIAEIEGLIDNNMGTGLVNMVDVVTDNSDSTKKMFKVSDFGDIRKLNEYYGGIYTNRFYQILAPAKGGKTKFCTRNCHTSLVKYGTNVSVWAQEGGVEAWMAQLRAIHFDYTYNTGADIKDIKYGVTQDVIAKDEFPNADLRDLELSSRLDLISNPEYGSLEFIDRPFNVETFIEDIDASVKSNNSKIVYIDYLQLIGSSTGIPTRERIADAYKRLLNYCKANNIAIVTPGQYKQDSINQLMNSANTDNNDLRTSAGESAEVIRTPDIIFALWGSTKDLRNHSMKILSIPSRFSQPFEPINLYVDLGSCTFVDIDDDGTAN